VLKYALYCVRPSMQSTINFQLTPTLAFAPRIDNRLNL
jgi:hypothetical protein